MSERRFFNARERLALYLISGGVCAECGAPLKEWHADHVVPYSEVHQTDISNGQALCPTCNLKKGARMYVKKSLGSNLPVWTFPLRDWQVRAYKKYQRENSQDFLVVATPGAGKTAFALRAAHDLLETDQVDVVIIICPTDRLRSQWAREAAGKKVGDLFYPFGLNILSDWTAISGNIPEDCHGLALTYHQVASPLGNDIIRWLFGNRRVFVIFDEVHHAGEDMRWGDSIWKAFSKAERRLCISGTPFRADNNRMPFVRYDENNRSVANFSYSYADALGDQICRPVMFPTFEGEMEWFSREGEYRKAIFQEILNETQASERLRTALSVGADWLPQVLTEANNRLAEIRADSDPRAGGLIIAIDTDHAEAIARRFFELTGIKPIVATSKTPDASNVIERFETSSAPWIIAVRMISEGVDIPRLRVLVFATNIMTELFFRQVVGRIVRVRSDLEEQIAYFYMPADIRLLAFAQTIKEERDHVIEAETELEREVTERTQDGGLLAAEFPFGVVGAQSEPSHTVFNAALITPPTLERAKRMWASMGGTLTGVTPEQLALVIMSVEKEMVNPAPQIESHPVPPHAQQETQESYTKRLKRLKTDVVTLINRYCAISGRSQKEVHVDWIRSSGNHQKQATEEELQAKKAWVIQLIQDWNRE